MPKAERILWNQLRNKQLLGLRFLRQYGVESFTLDFYCPAIRLAIEVDGDSHTITDEKQRNDLERQEQIENHGIKVIRVTNPDICKNLNGVMEYIYNEASKNHERLNPPASINRVFPPLYKGGIRGGFRIF